MGSNPIFRAYFYNDTINNYSFLTINNKINVNNMKLYAIKKFVKARNIREAMSKSYQNEWVQNMEITMEKDLTILKKEIQAQEKPKVDKTKKIKSIGF